MSDTERMVHELGTLLDVLLQADDNARKSAEHRLDELVAAAPADTLYALALIGQGVAAYAIDLRNLALLLLRRKAFTPISTSNTLFPSLSMSNEALNTPFDAISEQHRGRIEACLLECLRGEIEGRVRKHLADTVGKWVEESGKRGRPILELPNLLVALTGSPSPLHRLTTFQLLSSTPTLLTHTPITMPGSTQPARVTPEQIANVLEGGLKDANIEVRVQAVKATAQVLGDGDAMERKQVDSIGKRLVAEAVQVLHGVVSDPKHFQDVSIDLLNLAYSHPSLFTPSLPALLPFLQSVCLPSPIAQTSLPAELQPSAYTSANPAPPLIFAPDDIRSSPSADPMSLVEAENDRFKQAIEFILTIVECQKKATAKRWYDKEGYAQMVPVLLARMMMGLGARDGEEAGEALQDWIEETDLEADDDGYPVIPEDALDRLAGVMPSEMFLPTLFRYIGPLLSHPDWRARHVALMAICAVGENTAEVMSNSLNQVIQMVLPLASDPHPRVRYAVCHCFGQLATDFEATFLGELAPQIIQTEIALLSDPVHRVQAHAAASLVNLSDVATALVIRPHLDTLVTSVQKLLHGTPIYVQEQALTTLATVAITAEKDFNQYYGAIMPMLLEVLRTPSADGKEYRVLRSRAMECCGLIGMAVGKDMFQRDALELANLMARIQSNITEDDDPQISYLTTTWGKLAACLKADFAPFLPHVMPPLLAKAAQKPDMIQIRDPEDTTASEGYDIITITEDESVGIKTSAIEEKATNFEVLAIYIVELGTALAPYLEQILDLCLEGLRFLFDERVREAAANMLPPLLEIAKELGNAAPAEKIFTTLNHAFLREDQNDYLALLYIKFTECLQIMHTPLPPVLRHGFDSACAFQLTSMTEQRQRRRLELPEWDKVERDDEIAYEIEEERALDEMSRALFLVDESHPLLNTLGSVRSLAIRDAEEWEDEEDEE